MSPKYTYVLEWLLFNENDQIKMLAYAQTWLCPRYLKMSLVLKLLQKWGTAGHSKIYVVNSLRKFGLFLEMAITSANINRFCSYFQGLILTYISITFINKFFGSDEVEILALCSERPNLCPLMTISFLMEFLNQSYPTTLGTNLHLWLHVIFDLMILGK